MEQEKAQKKEEGFSLIEILLAIAILAIVSLGIMALLPNGYKQITNAGRRATMDHIAQMKLDYLRSIPISYIDLAAGTHPTTPTKEWPMPGGSADKYSVYWDVSVGALGSNSRNIKLYVDYDKYNADGSAKTNAIDQDSHTYTTTITQ